MNILYECSDLQFQKILEILSQEGIKLLSQRNPPKINFSERKTKGIITTLK